MNLFRTWKEAAEASQQAMLSVAGLDKDPTCVLF